MSNTLEIAKKYQTYMVNMRRHFHMHPEVSFKEFETSRMIRWELDKLAIPYITIRDTGIIATIQGAKPGKTILLRADMDALSVQELSDDCPYKSQIPGVMHACGHDGHSAAMLGAAHILTELRHQLCGTVKLLFESGEEAGGTIPKLMEEGYLDGLDHAFGLHLWSGLPLGKVACDPGARMAGTDLFTLKISGKGAHASTPNEGIDAIVAAASVIMNLQTIVSRELHPQDTGLITIGKLTAGQRFNTIADEAILEGNLRYFDPAIGKAYPTMINRVAENTAAAFRAKSEMIMYWEATPIVYNAPEDAAFGQEVVRKLLGPEALTELPPLMAGEDFGMLTQKVGGVFAFVGAGFLDRENIPHHNGAFDFDENCLPVCAALHAQYALDYLREQAEQA